MSAVITVAAQIDMLQDVLRDPGALRLYVGISADDPAAADFSEPTGGGYESKPMRAQAWDLSDAPQEAVYPKQTWTFDGPAGLVLGYYVTRNSDGRLRWYQPFVDENGGPAPMRIVSAGDQVSVTPVFCFASADDEGDAPDADEATEGTEEAADA